MFPIESTIKDLVGVQEHFLERDFFVGQEVRYHVLLVAQLRIPGSENTDGAYGDEARGVVVGV